MCLQVEHSHCDTGGGGPGDCQRSLSLLQNEVSTIISSMLEEFDISLIHSPTCLLIVLEVQSKKEKIS